MEVLKLEDINTYIGTAHIIRNLSLNVGSEEITYIVGRNGAGKTTTIKNILGIIPIASGNIFFKGQEITALPTHVRVKMGIGYAPEDRRIYPDLSVDENIRVASWLSGSGEEGVEIAYSIFPELKRMKKRKGLHLSGGEQKMLAIARALATKPSLLILDEPLEGLAPVLVERLLKSIREIEKMGVSMLVAESNLSLVPDFTDNVYVIERGEVMFSGTLDEIYKNIEVMKVIRGF